MCVWPCYWVLQHQTISIRPCFLACRACRFPHRHIKRLHDLTQEEAHFAALSVSLILERFQIRERVLASVDHAMDVASYFVPCWPVPRCANICGYRRSVTTSYLSCLQTFHNSFHLLQLDRCCQFLVFYG